MYKVFQKTAALVQPKSVDFSIHTSNRYQQLENEDNIKCLDIPKKRKSTILKKFEIEPTNDFSFKQSYFPELNEQASQRSSQSTINFSTLDYKQETYIAEPEYTLFSGNDLVIDYNDLIDIISDFKLPKMLMLFLVLNQKIELIKIVKLNNTEKSNKCLQFINDLFEKFSKQLSTVCDCLLQINNLLGCVTLCNNLTDTISCRDENDNKYESNKSHYFRTQLIYQLEKYTKVNTDYLKSFQNLSNDSINAKLQKTKSELINLIDNIVLDYNPQIDCYYHIYLERIDNNSYIHPYAICNFIYLDYETCFDQCGKIDLSVDLVKLKLDNIDTNTFSVSDLTNFFNSNKLFETVDSLGFFHITSRSNCIDLLFYYDINEDLPNGLVNVKITNAPSTSFVFYSILTNKQQINSEPLLLHNNQADKINKWLDADVNDDFVEFDVENYENNSNTNRYHIDYIFNELLKDDPTNSLISSDMINSFRKMAYLNSIKS